MVPESHNCSLTDFDNSSTRVKATRRIPSDLLHRALNPDDNRMLCALATMEELHSVIKHLNSNRAPGVDGFNGTFYRATCPIIAEDLLEVVNILQVSKELAQVNHTLLCLIPKKAIPACVDDYRPIVLCNVMYRIFSKLLANRLKPLLLRLTDLNYTAFISGRRIIDSILLAHELCHNLHSKLGCGRMCIKLDMSKAFDSLNRDFIYKALLCFNFDSKNGFMDA